MHPWASRWQPSSLLVHAITSRLGLQRYLLMNQAVTCAFSHKALLILLASLVVRQKIVSVLVNSSWQCAMALLDRFFNMHMSFLVLFMDLNILSWNVKEYSLLECEALESFSYRVKFVGLYMLLWIFRWFKSTNWATHLEMSYLVRLLLIGNQRSDMCIVAQKCAFLLVSVGYSLSGNMVH